jgi:hypothetical protein
VAITVAFEVADLWWQAQHGWATIAMTHALNRENGGLANIGTWVIGQLGMVTLALAWVWVAGLRFLWRSGRPLWRAMAWAYGLLFVLFAVTTGAQTYYPGAAYVYLLAAGAVAIDAWLRARPGRLRTLLLASALTTAVAVLIVLPVLPAADIAWTYKTNPTLGETVGWPQFVRTVDGVWKSLPPSQRASAAVESVRPPQPGMGRPRLYLHRSSPAVGPDMATAAPLRLTTDRRNRATSPRPQGHASPPMRTFSQGCIDGRDSRCPGAAESDVTCVAPVTGLVRRRRLARSGRAVRDLVSAGPFIGSLATSDR